MIRGNKTQRIIDEYSRPLIVIFRNEVQRYLLNVRSLFIIGLFGAWNCISLFGLVLVRGELFPIAPGLSELLIPPEGQEVEWVIGLSRGLYFGALTIIIACYFGALFANDIKPGILRLYCATPVPRSVQYFSRLITATVTTYFLILIGHLTLSIGVILIFSDIVEYSVLGKLVILFLKLQILQIILVFFSVCIGSVVGLITKRTEIAPVLAFMVFTISSLMLNLAQSIASDFQSFLSVLSYNYHSTALENWLISPSLNPTYTFSEHQWIISLAIFLGVPFVLVILSIYYFQQMDLD
ncbi:MAG: ABC transporter permease subunit [Candidatus Hodarchaeota archaeon]